MRLPSVIQDARLARVAARARRGDQEAVVALYRSLHPLVSRFVGRRVATAQDAEEAVAATFHRLLESLPRIDAVRGSVAGYAIAVARSVLADRGRTWREALCLEEAAEPEDPSPDPLWRLVRGELLEAVRRCLLELPSETRELLAMRFADGLRWSEIAAALGETEAAVRPRASRALREVRGSLRPDREGAWVHEP